MRGRAFERVSGLGRAARVILVLAPLGMAVGCSADGGQRVDRLEQASVCAASNVVEGIDVSSYQGAIVWSNVKGAGKVFAIARISDGMVLDGDFAANWAGMKSAGLIRGAYQYFEPADDPVAQADIVTQAVGQLGMGDLPVTADMETTGGQPVATIIANLQSWVSRVSAGTGKTPMIYATASFWDASVASSAFASLPFWVAHWGVTCPTLPGAWTTWSFWQRSDTGSDAGVSGAVDLDE